MYEKEMLAQQNQESLARKFYSAELSHLDFQEIHDFICEIRGLASKHRHEYVQKEIAQLKQRETYLGKLSGLEF